MRNSFKIFLLFILVSHFISCTKIDEGNNDGSLSGDIRAIVVSEGQFGYATGSLTTLSDTGEVTQDIFRAINNRPLGDVPQSLTEIGDYYYIPVNNSTKIEVVDSRTFRSIETMSLDLNCIPMYAAHLGGDTIAVSDQSSSNIPGSPRFSSLMIVDINHGKKREIIRRAIKLPFPTFQMKVIGSKLFVGGAEFSVFDLNNITEDGRRTVKNSENNTFPICDFSKITVDKNGNLWVVTHNNVSCIDVLTEKTIKELSVPDINDWTSSIDICPKGETVYVNARKKVYAINVDNPESPKEPIINHSNGDDSWTTYHMSVSKENTIFMIRVLYGSITRGRVFEYNTDGEIINFYPDSEGRKQPYFRAGIFPHFIHFI